MTTEQELPTSGIHDGIPEAEYHADPASLSSTGAKTILTEGPRVYKWRQDHPQRKDAFDLGSVIHALILDVGEYAIIDHDSWRTKAAQEAREQARAEGATPILAKDYRLALAVAEAVFDNPLAASILSEGRPEVSMWHEDPETGVIMRGRADYLRETAIIDVKTSAKPVHPAEWERTAWNFRYGLQAAWYQRILELNSAGQLPFLWIAVTTTEPHEVYVHQASEDLLAHGRDDTERALRTYADCLATDTWPGLADAHEIHQTTPPRWAR